MSRGINKVILIGNLGRDPEVRYTASGSAVCNFSLATAASWKDRETGERIEKTEWHRLVCFGRLAEIIVEHVRKGSQIYVEGRLQTREWQDQSGEKRYSTEVVVNEMQMLGRRNNDTAKFPEGRDKGGSGKKPDAAPAEPRKKSEPEAEGFDDDIPF